MIIGGGSPLNRVHEVLQRMQENIDHIESLKTCCGVLAILSRDEANKLLIARDGMRLIITVMQSHAGRVDLQEAACDLLWSLAFNNSLVKELVGRHGGIAVIIKGMQKHSGSADFLKSACGALSNMCQNTHNQNLIASHGGVTCLMKALGKHRSNTPLLPFIFDAMASLIVGNERNGLQMSEAGAIYEILAILSAHIHRGDMVKSGCHALAILSDIQGQGAKIARANGVKVVLSALRHHRGHSELHRVAAVVALRMLQEAAVASEIARGGGIPIMFAILKAHIEELETVAATIHILYLITHPDVLKGPPLIDVDQQIHSNAFASPSLSMEGTHISTNGKDSSDAKRGPGNVPAVDALVLVLKRYGNRKDLARAAVRSMVNLMRYPMVTSYLLQADALEVLLRCPCLLQGWSRDVTDGSVTLLKAWGRNSSALITGGAPTQGESRSGTRFSVRCTGGLLACLGARPADYDLAALVLGTLSQMYAHSPRCRRASQASGGANPAPHSGVSSRGGSSGNASRDAAVAAAAASLTSGERGDGAALTKLGQEVDADWELHVIKAGNTWMRHQTGTSQLGKSSDANRETLERQRMRSGLYGGKVKDIADKLCFLLSTLAKSKPAKEVLEEQKVPEALEAFQSMIHSDDDTLATIRQTLHLLRGETVANSEALDGPPKAMNMNSSFTLSGTAVKQAEDLPQNDGCKKDALGSRKSSETAHSDSKALNASSKMEDKCKPGEQKGTERESNAMKEHEKDIKQKQTKATAGSSQRHGRRKKTPIKPDAPPSILMIPVSDAKEPIVKPSINEFMNDLRGEAVFGSREELQPMFLVYEGRSAAGKDVHTRVEAPIPYEVPPIDANTCNPFTHQLIFDSCFESGNLHRAVQRGIAEYDLFLRADLHTPGSTQWFYFMVSNTHPDYIIERGVTKSTITFNIVNLTKPDSLFNMGMRPVMLSYQNMQKNIGWQRTAYNISYRANSYKRGYQAVDASQTYYTLSFTVDFMNPNDTYLLAHSFPYTYADHKAHLKSLIDDPARRQYIHHSVLCHTLANNECDLLTVTNFNDMPSDEKSKERAQRGLNNCTYANRQTGECRGKPCVVVSARVHPGETPASWMMRGFLNCITGPSNEAHTLRSRFVFKIIPMLNPDGVQFGNNRCSLAGVDLNRQWKRPSRNLHPTVYYTKALIRSEKQLNDVLLYLDLHGHSRKMNMFLYGLEEKRSKGRNPQIRLFPRLMSCNRIGKDYVSFPDCSFNAKKGRETTARVVVSREIGIKCSYTLESTFCGADFGPFRDIHFNTFHFLEVGRSLCDTFVDFFCEGEVKIPESIDSLTELKKKKSQTSEDIESESDSDDGEQSASDFPSKSGKERKPVRRRNSLKSRRNTTKRRTKKGCNSSSSLDQQVLRSVNEAEDVPPFPPGMKGKPSSTITLKPREVADGIDLESPYSKSKRNAASAREMATKALSVIPNDHPGRRPMDDRNMGRSGSTRWINQQQSMSQTMGARYTEVGDSNNGVLAIAGGGGTKVSVSLRGVGHGKGKSALRAQQRAKGQAGQAPDIVHSPVVTLGSHLLKDVRTVPRSKSDENAFGPQLHDVTEGEDPSNDADDKRYTSTGLPLRRQSKIKGSPTRQKTELPSVTGLHVSSGRDYEEEASQSESTMGVLMRYRSSSAPVKGKSANAKGKGAVRPGKTEDWLDTVISPKTLMNRRKK